jgi:hypothetical protein
MDRDSHEQVLRRSRLHYSGRFEFTVPQTWTLESLAGFVYSTSFLGREVLGEMLPAFEQDLAQRLLACQPDGSFELQARYAYELARRP